MFPYSPELTALKIRVMYRNTNVLKKKKKEFGSDTIRESRSPAVFRIHPILVTLWFCYNNIKCAFRGVFPFNSLNSKCLLFYPYVSSLCTLNTFLNVILQKLFDVQEGFSVIVRKQKSWFVEENFTSLKRLLLRFYFISFPLMSFREKNVFLCLILDTVFLLKIEKQSRR